MGQITSELRSLGAGLAGIAVTATFSQQAFAQSLGIEFPLLSDWERGICGAYGVRYREWKGHSGLAKRSVFVISTDAVIRWAWVTDDALRTPDMAAVVQAVRDAV